MTAVLLIKLIIKAVAIPFLIQSFPVIHHYTYSIIFFMSKMYKNIELANVIERR